MESARFDALSRAAARLRDRRGVMRLLAAGVLGAGGLAALGLEAAAKHHHHGHGHGHGGGGGGGCIPNCAGAECGDDGCGGSCGSCGDGQTCDGGTCVGGGCTPDCAGLECGDDGCGGSCGSCGDGQTCDGGTCVGGGGGGCADGSPCSGNTPDCCGDTCVDTLGDPDNCGGCGNVCDDGQTCEAGLCSGGGGGGDQCSGPVGICDADPTPCGHSATGETCGCELSVEGNNFCSDGANPCPNVVECTSTDGAEDTSCRSQVGFHFFCQEAKNSVNFPGQFCGCGFGTATGRVCVAECDNTDPFQAARAHRTTKQRRHRQR